MMESTIWSGWHMIARVWRMSTHFLQRNHTPMKTYKDMGVTWVNNLLLCCLHESHKQLSSRSNLSTERSMRLLSHWEVKRLFFPHSSLRIIRGDELSLVWYIMETVSTSMLPLQKIQKHLLTCFFAICAIALNSSRSRRSKFSTNEWTGQCNFMQWTCQCVQPLLSSC